MYFKGLTFIFSEDPPENHLMVIGGFLLKYHVLLLLLFIRVKFVNLSIIAKRLKHAKHTFSYDEFLPLLSARDGVF